MEGVQQAAATAAENINATTPTTGTGTPLMMVVSYILYAQCALIILLSLPYNVPYRKELLLWLRNSPSLWQVRVAYACVNAFLLVLLGDTYLRLDRVAAQISALQMQHLAAHPMAGAAPVATSAHQTTGGLHDLYSNRFRGQRDFYVIAFSLFTSTVLWQLTHVLIKLGRYADQRDELLKRVDPEKYNALNQPTSDYVAEKARANLDTVKASVNDTLVSAKTTAANSVESVRSTVGNSVQSAKATVGSSVDSVKSTLGNVHATVVAPAVETVRSVVDKSVESFRSAYETAAAKTGAAREVVQAKVGEGVQAAKDTANVVAEKAGVAKESVKETANDAANTASNAANSVAQSAPTTKHVVESEELPTPVDYTPQIAQAEGGLPTNTYVAPATVVTPIIDPAVVSVAVPTPKVGGEVAPLVVDREEVPIV